MNRTAWNKPLTQDAPRPQAWTLPETARAFTTRPDGLAALAQTFAPISLNEMDSVALLNRVDTKFMMTTAQLLRALNAVRTQYRMLSVDGRRLNHYRTLYFDTPDFALYTLHVTGRAEYYKVRSREYADSHQAFLEVKHKTRKDRTIKERIATARPVVDWTPQIGRWLEGVAPLDGSALEPKLWNTFTRITLVSRERCERVTLDVDLTFFNGEHAKALGGIAVAEVKRTAGHAESPFLAQMRAQRIRPQGFSKYCLGVALLYDQVKKNTLKPKMMQIEKLTRGAA